MKRRTFLSRMALNAVAVGTGANFLFQSHPACGAPAESGGWPDEAATKDWLARWEKSILGDAGYNRYCDKEMGEEIGWLISPFLNGFYYGYQATNDTKWVENFIDWTDSWIKRGVAEPDGFIGWPKGDGGGGESKTYSADSLLGEAMAFRPVVLMADEILKTPALESRWGDKARSYLDLAARNFQKWDSRDAWREVKDGGLWVVPAFGIDNQTGRWSEGVARKKTDGFSNPDNKENHIARWLVAMHDVTGKTVCRERAEKWFRLMKSRMHTREGTKYFVWDYWEPGGPWDIKTDGTPRHWVGVHPNGGYYDIDVEAIVTAYEHGLVFTKDDIDRLIATNRDFMWNQKIEGAKFQRIDGGEVDARWKNSPGVLWHALLPYDETLRKIFLASNHPAGWGGTSATPWFLARAKGRGKL